MKQFTDKVAVITGAASGLGRALAGEAARRGMRLMLADIEEAGLHETGSRLQAEGATVSTQVCDVSRAEDVEALAAAAYAQFGSVHLLFNNAGVGTGGLIWESTLADWEWVLGVNLHGVIHGIRSFTPRMLAEGQIDSDYAGHIVNTASVAGLLNAPLLGAYNVSKHAVVALSETLHHDLQLVSAPIAASVLCPYYTPTAIDRAERNRPPALRNTGARTASQQAAEALVQQAVAGGTLRAEQVAALTFEAIVEQRFYIHTHPALLGGVKARMRDILQARQPEAPGGLTAETLQLRAMSQGASGAET